MPFIPVNEMADRRILTIAVEGEEITVHEEYVVYDFNGIVGTVGGSLGLFVGFSYFIRLVVENFNSAMDFLTYSKY